MERQADCLLSNQHRLATYIRTPGGSLPPRTGGRVGPQVAFEHADGLARATIRGPFPPQLRRRMTPLELGMLVPLGTRRGLVAHASALTLGAISIDGPQARASLRQMIFSLTAPASPEDVSLFLIGDIDPTLEHLPHVARSSPWEGAGELLHSIQGELIRRARLLADAGEDTWGSRTDELLPALVIVASAPPAPLRGVVEAIGHEASKLGGTLFAVGWRPEQANLHILAEETLRLETDLPLPRQLQPFLLDEARAADAVQVVLLPRRFACPGSAALRGLFVLDHRCGLLSAPALDSFEHEDRAEHDLIGLMGTSTGTASDVAA